ncbi:hypothetical protein, partial [Moorena sp. SIO2C4]|uniref:hypothetical protein n=1 Tax=Moorena sp. SIO2C4 TaxID=2607824 RepID=UPI00257B3391
MFGTSEPDISPVRSIGKTACAVASLSGEILKRGATQGREGLLAALEARTYLALGDNEFGWSR